MAAKKRAGKASRRKASKNKAAPDARDVTAEQLEAAGFKRITPENLEPSELASELARLAGRYEMAARTRGDERASQIGAILRALSSRGEAFPSTKVQDWAGQARHWLKASNRGPRTRVQEAEALASFLARELPAPDGDLPRVVALLVQRMRVWPLLARDTVIPPLPSPFPDDARANAEAKVGRALADALDRGATDPEHLGKAVLRALGADPKKVRNLYAHRNTHG